MTQIGAIILSTKQQQDHGIHVKNYSLYRKYCKKKLSQMSKQLGIRQNNKKYMKNKELEENPIYHDFLVMKSERAWAYAMELKTRNRQYKKVKLNRRQIIRRLSRAYQYAYYLSKVMEQKSSILRLEAVGYMSIKRGQLAFECCQWGQSLRSLSEARIILEIIYENKEDQYLVKELIKSIERSIRYSAYQEKVDIEDIFYISQKNTLENKALTSFIESFNCEVLKRKSEGNSFVNSKIEWRGHVSHIRDADIAISLSYIQDLYKSIQNKTYINYSERKDEYNKLLSAYAEAENIIKKVIEKTERSGIEDQTQDLYITYSYISYNYIIEQIKYNLEIISELNMKSSNGNIKQYIVCKLTKLYDNILQNLDTISELSGISNDLNFLQTIKLEKYYFKSQRCLAISMSYFLVLDYKSALALAIRSYDYLSKISLANNKEMIFINEEKLIELKKDIDTKISRFRAFSCLTITETDKEESSLKMSTLGTVDNNSQEPSLSTLAKFPSKLESIFCKPFFFDIAYNYIDYKESTEQSVNKGNFFKSFLRK
ncbi:hypothetical protein T552_00163 [Pneumocystis carinii B80]|uniref:Signal recognition particle subunit SRP68 n=1 Tax=Pneumocystis carinii (strain B80) TaxID=1408658 RepID=A0A0W4ZT38_PNEC8|nr:hypothetical protein T552_00163 [Pneumocystis carinii B80]KTW31521.1 hypothetical protein T552_00163 [Pneumocystis carinii B80]